MSNLSNVLVFNRFQSTKAEEGSYEVVILKCEKFCTLKLKIKHNFYVLCNSSKNKVLKGKVSICTYWNEQICLLKVKEAKTTEEEFEVTF